MSQDSAGYEKPAEDVL